MIGWIVIGLVAGWPAGLTMSGGGYGIVRDILRGLLDAVIGGFASSYFVEGDLGFLGSIVVAIRGACIVIAVARILVPSRAPR